MHDILFNNYIRHIVQQLHYHPLVKNRVEYEDPIGFVTFHSLINEMKYCMRLYFGAIRVAVLKRVQEKFRSLDTIIIGIMFSFVCLVLLNC